MFSFPRFNYSKTKRNKIGLVTTIAINYINASETRGSNLCLRKGKQRSKLLNTLSELHGLSFQFIFVISIFFSPRRAMVSSKYN